jgi:hypothetical protein
MAMASGLMGATLGRALKQGSAFAIDLDSETQLKGALFTDSLTPDFNAANPYFGSAPYTSNQVSGTGYTAGGATLTGTSLAAAAGLLTFDATDLSWASSTITNAEGLIIYADGLTNKDVLAALDFGGPYSTSNGTFAITFNAAGIWYIDYIP